MAPVTAALIFLYGAVIAFLSGRMIHSADRGQVESALQARSLLTSNNRRAGPPEPFFNVEEPVPLAEAVAQTLASAAAAPLPAPPAHFQQVYFLLRLQEKVSRARREGHALSVIAFDVVLPGAERDREALEKLAFEVATMASSQAKTIDYCLQVSETEFAFVLAESDGKAARSFLARVVQAMGDYWCHCGFAAYPEDGTNAEALFDRARERAAESRGGHGGKGVLGSLLRRV